MTQLFHIVKFTTLLALVASGCMAADSSGFVPMFNSRDLSGWVPLDVAPNTFSVSNGIIVSTGFPTGLLRTERQYENFIIELEWRHMKPGGNAGLFIWSDGIPSVGSPFARGIEVQILDNGFNVKGKNEWYTTHGDVFPVKGSVMTPAGRISSTGARSFPTEDRSKSSPEWNHYRLEANNGDLRLSVNGKEVTVGRNASPRKGYLCLESEGSECHFRNVRIKELPTTNPQPQQIADPYEGFVPLYNGIDLSGWKVTSVDKNNWQSHDWILSCNGKGNNKSNHLWTEKSYCDFILICDWRWTAKPVQQKQMLLLPNGARAVDTKGQIIYEEVPMAGASGISLRGGSKSRINIGCGPIGSGEIYGYRTDPSVAAEIREGAIPQKTADAPIGQWNRFTITMKGKQVSVTLNGQTVIKNALLPAVPERGPIALLDRGYPIEFANIFIKEL